MWDPLDIVRDLDLVQRTGFLRKMTDHELQQHWEHVAGKWNDMEWILNPPKRYVDDPVLSTREQEVLEAFFDACTVELENIRRIYA
ncbi:MAG: hypothetical protein Q6370_017010 [Candidatus Sigynarchaeota archaeon]